jgi:hypothetical protein
MSTRKRLQFIPESQARGRVAEIYADVRESLGIPLVPEVYCAWAAYPQFLELHWEQVRPLARSQELFSLADRLRADCYTRAHNYFSVPDLRPSLPEAPMEGGAQDTLHYATELFHYLDPVLLLLVSAQIQALEAPVGRDGKLTRPAVRPQYSAPLAAPDEAAAPAAARKILDEMRRKLELQHLDLEYRVLARWPEFLRAYWQTLRPLLDLPVYAAAQGGLRETAWALAHELPQVVELPDERLRAAGMGSEEIAAVARISGLFFKNLSQLSLNLALGKIGLEGGNTIDAPADAPAKPVERVVPETRRGVA